MPPPQASERRPDFDPRRAKFICYIKYLLRGGAEEIRTKDPCIDKVAVAFDR